MGAPCFSRGKLDFSPARKGAVLRWALAPGSRGPGAKAHGLKANFSGALKHSFHREAMVRAVAPWKVKKGTVSAARIHQPSRIPISRIGTRLTFYAAKARQKAFFRAQVVLSLSYIRKFVARPSLATR